MKEYKIIWSPKAYKDLDDIYLYISHHLEEKNIAKKLVKKILDEILKLNCSPERYEKIKEKHEQNIRKMLVKNYLVIYEVDNDTRASFYFTHISWKSKLYE